jgi:hypothetical protein
MAVIVRVAGEGPALEFRRTNCLRTLLGDVGLSHRAYWRPVGDSGVGGYEVQVIADSLGSQYSWVLQRSAISSVVAPGGWPSSRRIASPVGGGCRMSPLAVIARGTAWEPLLS